jgi:hypothetical protein
LVARAERVGAALSSVTAEDLGAAERPPKRAERYHVSVRAPADGMRADLEGPERA